MEIINQTIETTDFTVHTSQEYYANCEFKRCNYAQAAVNGVTFENCTFNSCDFSLAKMKNTSWHSVVFTDCKLMGIDFTVCNPFSSFRFERCQLSYTNFHGMKLKQTCFVECDMTESYFSEADMEGSKFIQCNLDRALFHHTNLTGADFSTAYNLTIIPANNKLKNAIFSRFNLEGLVAHLGIKLKD